MSILFDLLYGLALLLGWPFLLYRRWTRGPGSLALRERMGAFPSRPVSATCVWLHGVSLGEINATRAIVDELRRRSPETVVVVSSTTRTGLERARALYPQLCVFRFPLDFSFVIRKALRHLRPSVVVLMELEVWPNLLEVADERGIPVLIVNGRVTAEKSMKRFGHPLARWLAARMFRRIRWVGAQETTYAERFVALGAPRERVEVTGSLKYDTAQIADHIEGQEQLAEEMGIDVSKPLWVCGSTGPDEEVLLLDAYETLLRSFPDLQLALIPRKPERFDAVASLVVSRGFVCLRRSTGAPSFPAKEGGERHVFLGDTLGELRKFYALATVVFVGRSLVPLGGSDVMEIAGLAKPLLVGPHTENFTEATELLLSVGAALRVREVEELVRSVDELLQGADRRRRMGIAGREAIVARQGATARTATKILEFLR